MGAIANAFTLLQSADNDAVTDQPDIGFARACVSKSPQIHRKEVVLMVKLWSWGAG